MVLAAPCNTLKNEYPQLGGSYEVVHHTQLVVDVAQMLLAAVGRGTPA